MNKIALITGCTSTLGTTIARSLSEIGYHIIGTYNSNYNKALELKNSIKNIDIYKVDFLNSKEVYEFIIQVKSNYKKIDILINNAALALDNNIENKTREEFMNVLEVNLVTPFILVQNFSNMLVNSLVINISSTDGINTYYELNIDYSASKAGLINLTKSLSLVLKNTKVVAICPNWINTESTNSMNPEFLLTEMNRVGQNKLIEPVQISNKIIEIINDDIKSGSIIVMEG